MTNDDLRALVRDVVARRLEAHGHRPHPDSRPARSVAPGCQDHPSHVMYVTVINADEACVIEPGARCDHCGYCKSHGH